MAVVETYGGTFVELSVIESEPTLTSVVRKQDSNQQDMTTAESVDKQELEGATKIAREKILALMLLNGANYKRHIEVRNQLANQFTQGMDSYPNMTKSAVRLLNNYKPLRAVQIFAGHHDGEEVAFMQRGK